MADDVLRMQAEVVDRFTGPLRSLQSQLRGIQSGSGVKAIKDGFDSAEKSALALGNSVRTVVNPALAAVGITGLGVAAALAGVGAALRGFSTDTAKLSFLSREVGVSAERLRVLESVGSKFGLSAEEMAGGVRTFSDNLDQIKRRTGDTYNYLSSQAQRSGGMREFFNSLTASKSTEEAVGRSLDLLARIPDAKRRADVAIQLFGSKGFAILGSEGPEALKKYVQEGERSLGRLPKAAEDAALAFQRQMNTFGDSLRGLRDTIGAEVLPSVNELLKSFDAWVKANGTEISTSFRDGLKDIGATAKTVAEALKETKGILEAFSAGRIVEGLRRLDGANGPLAQRLAPLQGDDALNRQQRLTDLRGQLDRLGPVKGGVGGGYLGEYRDRLTKEIEKLTEEIKKLNEGGTKAEKTGFDAGGAGAFGGAQILKAAFGGGASYSGGGYGGGGSRLASRSDPDASPDTSTGRRLQSQGAVKGDVNARGLRAMARLIGHGWTPEAAASAVGQFVEESSVKSDGPLGDTGRFGRGDDAAHGMAQWRGARYRALKKFAEARKKPWTDFDTQVDFFNEERKGRSGAERNWHKETDIGRGNRIGKMFEGYAGGLQAQRERHARGLLGAWRKGGVPVPGETGVASTHRYDGTDFDATRQGMAGRPEKSFVPSMDDASSSMMSKAIRAGMIGKQQHEVNGSLGVTIDSTGAPGTSVRAKASDIFKSVELRRGRSMAMASEDD